MPIMLHITPVRFSPIFALFPLFLPTDKFSPQHVSYSQLAKLFSAWKLCALYCGLILFSPEFGHCSFCFIRDMCFPRAIKSTPQTLPKYLRHFSLDTQYYTYTRMQSFSNCLDINRNFATGQNGATNSRNLESKNVVILTR